MAGKKADEMVDVKDVKMDKKKAFAMADSLAVSWVDMKVKWMVEKLARITA